MGMLDSFIKLLAVHGLRYEENISLSKLTSFRIGGEARIIVFPKSKNELLGLLKLIRESKLNFFILGNGTNILASDAGYDGVVIKLSGEFAEYMIQECEVKAGAMVSLIGLSIATIKSNLSGMEALSGIPGSLGGAVVMNAGAHGSEIADFITSVEYFDTETLEFITKKKHEIEFEYRSSPFKKSSRYIVVSVTLKLEAGNQDDSMQIVQKYKGERMERQPYDLPNAGSVFKNPEGYSAGKLIQEAGLKGYKINDAGVSVKHANFIVNHGKAKAKDVFELVEFIENSIWKKNMLNLEREIIFLGKEYK